MPERKLLRDLGQLPRIAAILACFIHSLLPSMSDGKSSFNLFRAAIGPRPVTSNITLGASVKLIAWDAKSAHLLRTQGQNQRHDAELQTNLTPVPDDTSVRALFGSGCTSSTMTNSGNAYAAPLSDCGGEET